MAEINECSNKRRRRPAGTPDPDAEVVHLSADTLMESERYVCEICDQGFQRDQNLQMHRRRHKVPWKLVKRERTDNNLDAKRRVFVCPEPTCLHHDPRHALGDLVGIKKHFRRKHSNHKQWVCGRCSKAYAVQSDYKAHLKTCGTRGHSCDCGRVFSRVESFIEHQDTCNRFGRHAPSTQIFLPIRTTQPPAPTPRHNVELQLLPSSNSVPTTQSTIYEDGPEFTQLHLSIGHKDPTTGSRLENSKEKMELALAIEARKKVERNVKMAEEEFSNAKRLRKQAQMELNKAVLMREHALNQIKSMMLEITCHSCQKQQQRQQDQQHQQKFL
ncbi:hypothetical protein ZOSMA_19G00310 [Zostera marina]|uniref:C2H2-type domain-containing protein n=1 Tax=Zostera marina TaxID=29655 RepID=A0A0K9PN99_ZOSMR|nr:hypothetical protein ZOSMA_19G00310 [Zostera marina]